MRSIAMHNRDFQDDRAYEALKPIIMGAKNEFPELDFSRADTADIEQMTCLLIAILNCYFSLVKLPLNLRPFIFGLIGASVGCEKTDYGWFYLRDRQLAIHIMGEDGREPGA